MRILALHPNIPHPLSNGRSLRSHQMLSALVEDHEVTLAAQWRNGEDISEWVLANRFAEEPILVPLSSNERASNERASNERASNERASSEKASSEKASSEKSSTAGERLRRRAPHTWLGQPAQMTAYDLPAFWDALAELPLDSFDAIQARSFTMIPYALAIRAQHPQVRLVLDLDDVPSVVTRRFMRAAGMRWISRWRFECQLDYWRIRSCENRHLREFDSVWICSEVDRERVAAWIGREKAVCMPNGVDVAAYANVQPQAQSQKLVFVADFGHEPNAAGARWFRRGVWPQIAREVPGCELWLVGRDPPSEIRRMHVPADRVHVTGPVASVRPFLEQAAVSIAPLHVGSGTRLKILEAMAAGLPVVSTTIGAEGIEAEEERDIVRADAPSAMAHTCVRLLRDPDRRRQMGEAGRRLVRQKYDWELTRNRIRDCYARLPRTSRMVEHGN